MRSGCSRAIRLGTSSPTTTDLAVIAMTTRINAISSPRGEEIAFILVVIAITALSVVVGELVPKRIALLQPERIAAAVAGPLQILVLIARPLVWFLETSTGLLLKLLRIPEKRADGVTE